MDDIILFSHLAQPATALLVVMVYSTSSAGRVYLLLV